MESNESLNFKSNSKGQKSSNSKYKLFHTNFAKLYKEKNLNLLYEEIGNNKNENDYEKNSFIKEYITYCEQAIEINETNLSQV